MENLNQDYLIVIVTKPFLSKIAAPKLVHYAIDIQFSQLLRPAQDLLRASLPPNMASQMMTQSLRKPEVYTIPLTSSLILNLDISLRDTL